MQQASQAAEGFSKTTGRLNSAMVGLGVVAGAAGASMIAFGIKSFNAAARVDELNYALDAIGKSTGLGGQALADEAAEVKGMGIEMEIAQKAVLKFAQNNLELGKASDIARIAQDLAIISGENSTDTFNKLTHAVITGRSEVLKSVGIQENAGQMYAKFAKSIGKTTKELNYQEKQQAVLAGVMAEGVKVFGTYEAAMKSPGKTLRSFKRLHNELQVAMGDVLLKAFGPLILAAYDLEKAITKAVEKNATLQVILRALREVFIKLTQPLTDFIKKITDAIKGFDVMYTSAENASKGIKRVIPDTKALAEKFEMLLPPIAAATAGLATFAGRGLLQNLPIIGNMLTKLKVFPVMMVVLALTSTQVRKALVNLFTAFQPLVPVLVQISKVMGDVSAVGVMILAKAINILAAIVRRVFSFIQKNIDVFKVLLGVVGFLAVAFLAYRGAMIVAGAASALYTLYTAAMTYAHLQLIPAIMGANAALLANPIPLIIGLVIALITAFGYLMATNENFRENVKNVFNFVLKTIIYVASSVVSAFGIWVQGIAFLIRVFSFFLEAVVKIFEVILDITLTYISSVLKGYRFLIDGFISLMETHGIFYDVVKFIFNAVIRVITLVIGGIIKTFANLVGGVADLIGVFNFLFKGVRSIFLSILDAISGVGNGIFKILENVARGIGDFLGDVFDAVTGWVRSLLSVFSKIPKIGPIVADALNGGLDVTRNAITGIASLGVDLGKNVFNGVVNGVKSTVNGIANIGTSTEKSLRGVEATLSKFSAKVVEFGKEDNGAKMIALLVKGAKGASSGLTTVIDAIQKVIDAPLSTTVGDFIDGIAGKVDKAGEMVMGLAVTMQEFADKTDFAAVVGDKIGDFIEKIKNSLKEGLGFGDILADEKKKYSEKTGGGITPDTETDAEKAAARIKTIRDAMQAGIDSIKGVLDDLQQAAKDFADSLKDTIVGFAGLKSIELPDGFIPKAKSLIDNMSKRLDKSKQFAGQIAQLQSMGLDSDALKSIIEEGPIKGAQIAASILGGGQSAIDEISRLQKEIQFTGAVIGAYGSEVAFGDKISEATNTLRSLQYGEMRTGSAGGNVFIEQGAFQVMIDTSGAANEEEKASIITKRIEETFATLARQLASK
jgi:phage-related protein